MMWKKYKRRVLLAMSSQAFAQLVRHHKYLDKDISPTTQPQNGINGTYEFAPFFEFHFNPLG